ncbi:hypothetical protein ABV409_01150 [Flagellimonas sp. DF-77]|uniref:hypothetical protein n=1 Tax=Flagellimonas algarum TaxID=3230298 RepID=UPI003394E757
MRNYIYAIILSVLCFEGVKSQHVEDDYQIYAQALQKVQNKIKDTIVFEVGSNPLQKMYEDMKAIGGLTKKQLKKVERSVEAADYVQSQKLKGLLIAVSRSSPPCKENGGYTKRFFSRPIYVARNKALLFRWYAAKNKKYKGGKAIGASLAEQYIKKDGQWVLEKVHRLSMY